MTLPSFEAQALLRSDSSRGQDAVAEALRTVAAVFSGRSSGSVPLRYAPELGSSPHSYAALAVELVYEGYLLHYRNSRVLDGELDEKARLLAGDYFYAHGLRLVAQAGDLDAVGLLAQLMAACSYARIENVPLVVDDALWDLTALAVGSGDARSRESAARVHCEVADLIAADRGAELLGLLGPAIDGLRVGARLAGG